MLPPAGTQKEATEHQKASSTYIACLRWVLLNYTPPLLATGCSRQEAPLPPRNCHAPNPVKRSLPQPVLAQHGRMLLPAHHTQTNVVATQRCRGVTRTALQGACSARAHTPASAPASVVGDDAQAVLQRACVVVDSGDNLIVLCHPLLPLHHQRGLQGSAARTAVWV